MAGGGPHWEPQFTCDLTNLSPIVNFVWTLKVQQWPDNESLVLMIEFIYNTIKSERAIKQALSSIIELVCSKKSVFVVPLSSLESICDRFFVFFGFGLLVDGWQLIKFRAHLLLCRWDFYLWMYPVILKWANKILF